MLTKSIIALTLLSVGLVQAAPLPDDPSGQSVDLSSIALKREPHHHNPKHTSGKREPSPRRPRFGDDDNADNNLSRSGKSKREPRHQSNNGHSEHHSGKREPHHHEHNDHPEHVNSKREPRHQNNDDKKHNSGKRSLRDKLINRPVRNSGKREPGAMYSRPRIVKPLVKPIPKREPGAILSSLHKPNHPSLGGKGKREPGVKLSSIHRPNRPTGQAKREPHKHKNKREPHKHKNKREPFLGFPKPKNSGKREPLEFLPSLN